MSVLSLRRERGGNMPCRLGMREMCVPAAMIMLLTVVKQVDSFYVPNTPLLGRSRYTVLSARKVSALPWSTRPARPGHAGRRLLAASTYAEYMALRRDREVEAGGEAVEDPPVDQASTASESAHESPPVASAVAEEPAAATADAVTDAEASVVITGSGDDSVGEGEEGGSPEGSPADDSVGTTTPEGENEGDKEGDKEGDGEEDAVGDIVAEEEKLDSRLDLLSESMGREADQAILRSRRMSELTSNLRRSVARKEEVERVIVQEIGQLSLKLRQERDVEYERQTELQSLLKEFDEAIEEKQQLIEAEKDLLAQMQALREQVTEASIRTPIDAAMAKKADVTSIEVVLLEDLVDCKEKLTEELQSTASRAATIAGVVEALPGSDDTSRMRAYNWQDVQDLQEVLLSSVESMEASDAQVAALREKLAEAVQKKRVVLGEVPTAEIVPYEGEGAGDGALRMSPVRAFQSSLEMSQKELLDDIAQSSSSAAVGVAKTLAAGVSSLGRYAKSPEAQGVAASTVDAIGAISGAVKSVGGALDAAKEEFDENTMDGEELTTFDKIFTSLRSGFSAVIGSTKVKSRLSEAKELVGKQLPEASARVGKGAVEALKGAAADENIGNPVKDALNSLGKVLVSLAALGGKSVQNSRMVNFQLPGSVAPTAAIDTEEETPSEQSPEDQSAKPPVVEVTAKQEEAEKEDAGEVAESPEAKVEDAAPRTPGSP